MVMPENLVADRISQELLVEAFSLGVSVSELATKLAVPAETIREQLRAGFQNLQPDIELEQEFALQSDLVLLRKIQQEALQAWERSKQPRQKTVVKTVRDAKGERTETTVTTEHPVGDPRFLSLAMKCMTSRTAWRKQLPPARKRDPNLPTDVHARLRQIIAEARERMQVAESRRKYAQEIERQMAAEERQAGGAAT